MAKTELFENADITMVMCAHSTMYLAFLGLKEPFSWDGKKKRRYVNDRADGKHRIRFRSENTVFRFIWISVTQAEKEKRLCEKTEKVNTFPNRSSKRGKYEIYYMAFGSFSSLLLTLLLNAFARWWWFRFTCLFLTITILSLPLVFC